MGGLNVRFFRILNLLCFLSVQVGAWVAPAIAHQYIYSEQTGDEQHNYTWEMEQRGNTYVITSISPEQTFTTLCSPDGSTMQWSFSTPAGDNITAEKEGDSIRLRGEKKGKSYDETIALDNNPWLQPLSFSLRPLVLENIKEKQFVMLRPDTLEGVYLKAVKKECSTVTIAGREEQACKVEVKKAGMLAPFWHVSYWFRKSDGMFVQYKGVHGLPGTPETLVQLAEKK